MSRKKRREFRRTLPDPLYGSTLVAKLINSLMKQGKKIMAQEIVYNAMQMAREKLRLDDALAVLNQALSNAKPAVEVRARRIGGATYQIPIEIPEKRRTAMAIRWLIQSGRKKPGMAMERGLGIEIIDCYQNQGVTVKKKENIHRMAEANKAYASYRW